MSARFKHRYALALGASTLAAILCSSALAQEDWKEIDAPPAPAWRQEGLIPIEMPIRTNLSFGLDPRTVSIGSDFVVRYVIVASSSSGSVNAMYEGLRCDTREVKTYARASAPGEWRPVAEPQWRTLDITQSANRHSLALARQGVCESSSLSATTVPELLRRLKNPPQNLNP